MLTKLAHVTVIVRDLIWEALYAPIETPGGEMQLSSFLGHARNSIPQPSNSISDFRGVLRIVSAFNKLFDAIEAQ